MSALDPRVVPVASRQIQRNWGPCGPFLGWLLTAYGAVWTGDGAVERMMARVDRSAICWTAPRGFERATTGAPHESAKRLHLGAARIALATGCPIVPISIVGLEMDNPPTRHRRAVHVLIGETVSSAAGENAESLTARYLEHLEETRRRHSQRLTV